MADAKFPWEYDVPKTPFWADLKFTTGRNFLQALSSSEIGALERQFEARAASSREDKLRFLLCRLQAAMAAREAAAAPARLHEADYVQWSKLLLAIETMQGELGLPEEMDTIQTFLDNPRLTGGIDYAALNRLAVFKEKKGEYVEAEGLARQVLPWMQNHEMLGRDSPQALGTTRTIIRTAWKQGRLEEAGKIAGETGGLIARMGGGRFAKYQDEEKEMLADLLRDLETAEGEKGGAK